MYILSNAIKSDETNETLGEFSSHTAAVCALLRLSDPTYAPLSGWSAPDLAEFEKVRYFTLSGKTVRMYHLIAVNVKTREKTRLTKYPMNHKQCMTMKSKFNQTHKLRTLTIEQVNLV
jgi:hypothetical protein